MNILALDSALSSCSAAVMKDGKILSEIFEKRLRGQAERLVPMCQEACDEAAVPFYQLDAIAVTRGPGTFTGVRIGLAAAKGLSLALDIPLIGVTTLEAVAHYVVSEGGNLPKGKIFIVHDARRSEVYMQIFDQNDTGIIAITEPAAIPLTGIEKYFGVDTGLVVGSGAGLVKTHLSPDIQGRLHFPEIEPHPQARIIAQIAADRLSGEDAETEVMPLYLRAPDAVAAKPIVYPFQNK